MKLKMPNWNNVRVTAKHWHYAAVALLCLINLVLGVRLIFAWRSAEAGNTARLEQHKTEYRAMQLKTKPLRGLDKKISQAQLDELAFYEKRFPDSDSEVLREMGALAVKNNVLMSRVQYAHGKANEGARELLMEASLSGDYAPVVRFINSLERDKVFFLIDGIALNGQQNGIVSLRMRLKTYLRPEAVAGGGASTNSAAGGPAAGAVHPVHLTRSVPANRPIVGSNSAARERH